MYLASIVEWIRESAMLNTKASFWQWHGCEKTDPTYVHDVLILILMFPGFLRESEVVALQTDVLSLVRVLT